MQIIQKLYNNTKARIITDRTGDYFSIQKGIWQGDPLSPILFYCALEEIFRGLNWEKNGININGEYLNNLRFAEDVVLIAKDKEELHTMIEELDSQGK